MSNSEEDYAPWFKVIVDDEAEFWDDVVVLEAAGGLDAGQAGWRCCQPAVTTSAAGCFSAQAQALVSAGGRSGDKEWVEVKVRRCSYSCMS